MDLSNGIALVQSKTFWGALLALVAIMAKQFGASSLFTWATDAGTVDNILTYVSVAGTLVSIIGRAVASKPVTGVLSPAPKSN